METEQTEIYSETIVWVLRKLHLAECIVIDLVLGIVYFIYAGITGAWYNPILFLLGGVAMCMTLYSFAFTKLKIRATLQSFTIWYGVFRRVIFWENIADCYLEKISYNHTFWAGFDIARFKGKWKLIYLLMPAREDNNREPYKVFVSLRLKKGIIKEVVFPTNNLDAVMELVKKHIGKQEKQETIA